MKHLPSSAAASLALLAMAWGLTACSGLLNPQTGAAQKVDGLNYRIEQITASTWTATPPVAVADSRPHAASLVQAIEKASGCKVTDSSFAPQGTVLSAQVDCGNRLKN